MQKNLDKEHFRIFTFGGELKTGKPSLLVRLWEEVYSTYRNTALGHGLKMSDLVSLILLYTPVYDSYVVDLALRDNYDISREEVYSVARELETGLRPLVDLARRDRRRLEVIVLGGGRRV